MPELPLRLDRGIPTPLPAQLAAQVRALVLAGTLPTAARLPSSRALAADLGVSRFVTEQAYEQLLAEGWTVTRRGAGTFVAARADAVRGDPPRPRAPDRPSRLVRLDTGTPWAGAFGDPVWRRAWREVSTATPPRGYDDSRGIGELRVALAERLGRTRGLVVDPDEIVVTTGTVDALGGLLPVLPPGPVGIEDPGYRGAVEAVRGYGRRVVDLPADAPLRDLGGLVAAYVTPAHQHPLGHVLPAAERLALLTAARDADALLIEDDYDSEFRYDVAPVPALATLDRDRVVYVGTASKSVLPSLRLGWMLAPRGLVDDLVRRRETLHAVPSWPSQRAMATLLRDGWVDKAMRAARRVYARRAPRVVEALAPYATPAAPPAGMYSTWLLPGARAIRARDAARAAGFHVGLLTDYTRSSTATGLVVGFGGGHRRRARRGARGAGRGAPVRGRAVPSRRWS